MPSSVIKSFQYDPTSKVLRIEYQSGMIYDYIKVPAEVYDAMRNAFSKGTYLNRYIKGKYAFKKINISA